MKTINFIWSALLLGLLSFSADAQNISSLAGSGTSGFSGDGSNALTAKLNGPQDVGLDTFGNIYIADAANNRIRKVTASTGIITTIAGTGSTGYSGDGGAATSATFSSPIGLAVDNAGNIYIADNGNHCIRKITASTGTISTVAGNGSAGFSGDGADATLARLYAPYDVTVDSFGNLYIADVSNNRIRKVTASTGIMSTVAGTGTAGFSGDGAAATSAKLYQPFSVAVDDAGNLYIADANNQRIRKVSASTGIITTIAGTGTAAYSGDGSAATSAQFNTPYSIALDKSNNIYISDFMNNRVRKINASTGIVSTIAGTGVSGYSGDGGPATSARISYAKGIFVDRVSNVYIADEQNQRVRFICNAAKIPDAPLVTSPVTLCTSSTPGPLTAIGSNLKWYSSAIGGTGSSSAPVPSVAVTGSTTYYVSQSSACGESSRSAIVVNVVLSPAAPAVTTPVTYCSGDVAVPLAATGSGLQWYTSASGGTGSAVAPTPSTTTAGTFVYYVSQGTVGCESSRSAISVTINPRPLTPSVTDVVYCIAAIASPLTAPGSNLKWYTVPSGGTSSDAAPTPSTVSDGTTSFYVTQTNSFGCESFRAKIDAKVYSKPDVSITATTAPKYFICKGNTITLKTIVTPYGNNFQWQAGTIAIPGATADTFVASSKGLYRVIVSNAPNCNDTDFVLVDEDTSIIKTSISPVDVNICEGVNLKLFSATVLGAGYKFQWIKNGVLLADTTETIVIGDGGDYSLKVTNASGCNVTSNTAVVSTYPSIPKPVVTQVASILSVPAVYDSYQWYRNGRAIGGDTSSSMNLLFDGNYWVEVSDKNGCKKLSDTVLIQKLSVDNLNTQANYTIYPNPTTGKLIIDANQKFSVDVLDILGKSILSQQKNGEVDLSNYPDGVYLLRMRNIEGKSIGIERVLKGLNKE